MYPVIALPFVAGFVQLTTMFDPLLEVAGAIGVDGISAIVAPLPIGDVPESPIMLVAITLACTESELTKRKGEALSAVTGIVQLGLAMEAFELPSQFTSSRAQFPSFIFR